MAGRGRHAGSRAAKRRRTTAIVLVLALVLAAFGGVYVAARGGQDGAQPPATPTLGASPTHTRSPKPTASASPSVAPTPSATVAPDTLPNGRSFVYAKAVDDAGEPVTFTFDLAEYLTDQEAADAAAAHGDESPPPNGYYIVNDNPRLRTMPLSSPVQIRYYPSGGDACCNLQPGTVDGFAAAVNGSAMTDYPDMSFSPWWVTVQDGVITKISQQYLP